MYAVISEYFNFNGPDVKCSIVSYHDTLDLAREKVNVLKNTDEYINVGAHEKVILRIVKCVEEA